MSVNAAFVRAIATIKTLTRSPNTLGRPPQESKTTLYGLYKQATEGDVEGILERPHGASPQDKANQRKWDAWKQQEGLSKDEAKLKYIEFLLETMRSVSPDTPQSRGLVNELEALYITARDGSELGEPAFVASHVRTPSYSQFLRRPTYSEFGLSQGDRTEIESISEFSGGYQPQAYQYQPMPSISQAQSPQPQAQALTPPQAQASSPGQPYSYIPAGYGNYNYPPPLDTISEEISLRRIPPPDDPYRLWRILFKLLQRFGQRVAVDICGLTLFLIVARLMRRSPYLPQGVRQGFTIVGNVIAVVLREVGFDIRIRPRQG